MARAFVFVILVQWALCSALLAAPFVGLYDVYQMYDGVEVIELVPGVAVRADIWPDDYVPTVEDFVALGVPYDDAIRICGANPPRNEVRDCTWGQIKMCFGGTPNECCPDWKSDG